MPAYYVTTPGSSSRNNVVRVTVGIANEQGFFREIDSIHCYPSGELLVQGYVGFGAGKSTFQGHSTYAYGLWKVASDGAINAVFVKPYKFQACGGNLAACETQNPDVWKNVEYKQGKADTAFIGTGQKYDSALEDKHGNVWAIEDWSVIRFNKDGTKQVVLDSAWLGKDAPNIADWKQPLSLRYDKVRDEVVFLHNYWGSGEGNFGIWRITQQNEPKEVVRFLTKGRFSVPSSNLVPGKWADIGDGFSVDSKGTIWFTGKTDKGDYLSQAYQVIDSVKNLKKLPYSGRSPIKAGDLGSDRPIRPFEVLGRQACFDGKDTMYFTNGTADVLRRETNSGKATTWVK